MSQSLSRAALQVRLVPAYQQPVALQPKQPLRRFYGYGGEGRNLDFLAISHGKAGKIPKLAF